MGEGEVGAVGEVEAEGWWIGELWSEEHGFCDRCGFGDWSGVLDYFEGGHRSGCVLNGRGHCWWGCLEVDVWLMKDMRMDVDLLDSM